MTRIMIIRHAEKPHNDGPSRGVNAGGHHDKHDLTVRGWQRAGALVRYFAPHGPSPDPLISEPRTIFAAAATEDSPSLRSQHTVEPLAKLLGLPIQAQHAEDGEHALAEALLAAHSPVLVAWHHTHITDLVRAVAGEEFDFPAYWPDDRFDVVWVLDRDAAGAPWRFGQAVQRLLPKDRTEPIGRS